MNMRRNEGADDGARRLQQARVQQTTPFRGPDDLSGTGNEGKKHTVPDKVLQLLYGRHGGQIWSLPVTARRYRGLFPAFFS